MLSPPIYLIMEIKQQHEFPLRDVYAKVFPIDDKTLFAYDDCIYTNYDLPKDLLIHEMTHLHQQKRDGLEYWVKNYLHDPKYRLEVEIEAYKAQLSSIKDRNWRSVILNESANNLSSKLYGNLITKQEALKLLKV